MILEYVVNGPEVIPLNGFEMILVCRRKLNMKSMAEPATNEPARYFFTKKSAHPKNQQRVAHPRENT